MTPAERAQRIRQESESAGETVDFLLLAVAELVQDLASAKAVRVSGERTLRREQKLDLAGAAQYLNVSPYTLSDWARAGRVASTRAGNEYRFTYDQLDNIKPAKRRRVTRGTAPAPVMRAT